MAPTRDYTEQEKFWSGEFGAEYVASNDRSNPRWPKLPLFFHRVLSHAWGVERVLECGASLGANLDAIRSLLPQARLEAIEINPDTAHRLAAEPFVDQVHCLPLADFSPQEAYDLVFTKGVLIHIDPAQLPAVYDRLHALSRRYVLLAEYYNRHPEPVPYKGRTDLLFKRDFAGEFMDRHPDMRLVDYGFVYHRDPLLPLDDVTWFLMEKEA
jgi:spore coat polysaccharide biosynthesis protein SpsF